MSLPDSPPPQISSTEISSPSTAIPINQSITHPSSRPGRLRFLPHPDIDLISSYGDPVTRRDPSHIRIFFQNVKGLTYCTSGVDYDFYFASINSMIGPDICGMAETNTAWQHFHLRSAFKQSSNRHFPLTKEAYSSPSHEVDPILERTSFQAGHSRHHQAGSYVSRPILLRSHWARTMERNALSGQKQSPLHRHHCLSRMLWNHHLSKSRQHICPRVRTSAIYRRQISAPTQNLSP